MRWLVIGATKADAVAAAAEVMVVCRSWCVAAAGTAWRRGSERSVVVVAGAAAADAAFEVASAVSAAWCAAWAATCALVVTAAAAVAAAGLWGSS